MSISKDRLNRMNIRASLCVFINILIGIDVDNSLNVIHFYDTVILVRCEYILIIQSVSCGGSLLIFAHCLLTRKGSVVLLSELLDTVPYYGLYL